MKKIVIIGGSIMGSSTAYHMAMAGAADNIVVIEPDPTYGQAAAPRSAGGVRLMHGLRENIEMSRYGQEVYRNFASLMDVDGEPGEFLFREYGYLYLVAGREDVATAEQSWRLQTEAGVANEMLSRSEVAERFPLLRTDDVDAGLYGAQDGFIDPYAAVMGFRRKAQSLGVEYVQDRVTAIGTNGGLVDRVTLASGETIAAEAVVNVAGAWAPEICAMVGMSIPVEPLYRPTFYFETDAEVDHLPLTKDPSGVAFRKEGRGFATGLTQTSAAGGFRWDVGANEHEQFENELWPALAHRLAAFESLKVKRSWAGHYAINRLDGNTIIGNWRGQLDNFYLATGFSGAGLQKGPAIGRALSELLLHSGYRTIDLTRLSYQRVVDNAPLLEVGFKA
ncbi:MAG: FAD-binding oxidoreductase [Pseudomonadota bacterium]